MQKPAKSQHFKHLNTFKQIAIGVLIGLSGVALQNLFQDWAKHTHYIFLFPSVMISSYFGGGFISGFSATLVTTVSSALSLSHETSVVATAMQYILPTTVYFVSNLFISIFGELSLQRERDNSRLQVQNEESERLKFAAESAKLGIWEWEFQKDILHWDDRMYELYGITRYKFTEKVASWEKFIHPDDFKLATGSVAAAIRGEKDYNIEFRIITPDGITKYIHGSAIILRDKKGQPWKMFGQNRDITEEKNTLHKIQELKAFFEAAMSQSQAGILIVDAQTDSVRFINETAIQILEQNRESITNINGFHDNPPFQMSDLEGNPIAVLNFPLNQSITNGVVKSQEYTLLLANGQQKVVLVNTAPIKDQNGKIIAGIKVFFDTTERHRLFSDLKAARDVAEVSMRAKSRFLDIAAHELKTPVTAFSVLLELTEMRLSKGISVTSDTLKRFRSQISRLSILVTDLLEVAKMERGTIKLKTKPTDIGQLIQECVTQFKELYPLRLFEYLPVTKSVIASVDSVKIIEVISNLIDNSVKYTPEETPIKIKLEELEDQVRISVIDLGPGIRETQKENLFKPFERGTSSDEEKHSGLGLGLFISKGIVERHGGKLEVKSTPGQGSVFCMTLQKNIINQESTHGTTSTPQ